MLKKLSLENFRNITEEIDINFSKITLLFGMNNVGKSSIVSALDIIQNIDSKLDVPLITDLSNYGSINNLYSKHNEKDYFKIKYDLQIKDFDLQEFINKSYTLNYYSKDHQIIKNLIFHENEKKIIELETDGKDFLYFKNILTNSNFDDSINNFFKDEKFASDYFVKNLNSFLDSIPAISRILQLELWLANIIEFYNLSNPNDIHINRSDLFNYINILNSNDDLSLKNFFEEIKKNEDISDLLHKTFFSNAENELEFLDTNDLKNLSNVLISDDFDPFDYQNDRLLDFKHQNDFQLLNFRSVALFCLYIKSKKLPEIEENYSITPGLLKLILFFYYVRNFLKQPITNLMKSQKIESQIGAISLKDEDEFDLYIKHLEQVETFSKVFLKDGNQIIDKQTLIDNLLSTPDKLLQDNFVMVLGGRMLAPSYTYKFSIFNIFKMLSDKDAFNSIRKKDTYRSLEPSWYLRDFFHDIPYSKIYLGEDTSQRVFTYRNSNSFYDLLYKNRKNINLLTKIADEIRKLGFDVNEIKIDSDENTYRIKIISSKSTTDLIDCGKGIKRLISILSQIYCNKKSESNFQSPNSTVICIEEPEANIHPKIQSELGSMLSNSIQQNIAKQILIETHSENLTLRLLKLIREKKLKSDDVSINCLYLDENKIVRSKFINITENGDIIDEWPGGFFEESLDEIV